MPNYYAIYLNLESRICLVVGAGPVGARKAAGLLESGAKVRLVAKEMGAAAAALVKNPHVEVLQEAYHPHHLDSVLLAFAATDNTSVNAQIVADARARSIPVNSAGSIEYEERNRNGEFIVPATLRRGKLCVAISTSGASPKLAQRIKADLEALYTVEYSAYMELLEEMRSYIKEHVNDPVQKSLAFASLIGKESETVLRSLLRDEGREDARTVAHREAVRIVEAALDSRSE